MPACFAFSKASAEQCLLLAEGMAGSAQSNTEDEKPGELP